MQITRFRFRFLLVLIATVLFVSNTSAQLNADREFVRKNQIKSALIKEKRFCDGVLLDYDTAGRLYRVTVFGWSGLDVREGRSFVTVYDSLGRYLNMRHYEVSDSAHVYAPTASDRLTESASWSYPDNNTVIVADTSWDYRGRITRIEQSKKEIIWRKLPDPPEYRSVFYADKIVASQQETWSKMVYSYSEQDEKNVQSANESHGVVSLTSNYESEKIFYHMQSNTYQSDSVTNVEVNAWYSLHGKTDTSFSSYKRSIEHIGDSITRREFPELINYSYVLTKKQMGKYTVRYNLSHSSQSLKLRSKEPWLDYRFDQYPASRNWNFEYNYSQTITEQSRQYPSGKPVYTYWSRTNR